MVVEVVRIGLNRRRCVVIRGLDEQFKLVERPKALSDVLAGRALLTRALFIITGGCLLSWLLDGLTDVSDPRTIHESVL